jgi:hypothetical protein
MYLANASTERVRAAMRAGAIGMMATPAEGRDPEPFPLWAADNGCYGNGYPGDDAWIAWLTRHAPHAARCLFATAPDVVGDAWSTLSRSTPFLPIIRGLGYPAGFVAQDGAEDTGIPWDDVDALFLGGSTEWKQSEHAARLANAARSHGKWVHMGRVNSWRRWQVAEAFGCDSCDGTYLAFGPDKLLPTVLGWTAQGALW